MKYSDLIIPHGVANDIAIQFISENLKNKMISRGVLVNPPSQSKPDESSRFTILFDIIDEVLITYKAYSKQVHSIRN